MPVGHSCLACPEPAEGAKDQGGWDEEDLGSVTHTQSLMLGRGTGFRALLLAMFTRRFGGGETSPVASLAPPPGSPLAVGKGLWVGPAPLKETGPEAPWQCWHGK